jgi:hypothetical protein
MEVQTLPAAIDGTWAACLPAPALKSNIAVSVADWPTKLDADLAWDASTFGSEEAYTLLLTKEDVLEIRAAVKHFNCKLPLTHGPCGETGWICCESDYF